VKKAEVPLLQTDGAIVIAGSATRPNHTDNWLFACSLPDPSIRELRVKVKVCDFPENSKTTECLFPFPFIDTLIR
jgi:hypothetical protein